MMSARPPGHPRTPAVVSRACCELEPDPDPDDDPEPASSCTAKANSVRWMAPEAA